ncbi:MAG: HNH endonuclease signature motif containing protein [Nocardioides sp.]
MASTRASNRDQQIRPSADSTKNLPPVAAAFVDRQIAPVLHDCSYAQIERTVETARATHDPAETERRRLAAAEHRHLHVHLHHVDADGLVAVEGLLDLADAIAFDKTLTARAATLDPELPLDVRRSMAAGTLDGELDGTGAGREVVVYTHARPDQAMVEVENTRTTITPDQVREWCTQAGTKVTVRPVLDLSAELTTEVHDPTPTMREQAWARYPTCVFAHCQRPSRRCDLDHRTPYPAGATTTSNLYPLCRRHHRLKTTGGWHYQPLNQSLIEWTSPTGLTHHRHLH